MRQEFVRSKELKEFTKLIEEQWGAVPDLFSKVAFAKSKERIYMVNRDLDRIDLEQLRINNVGIYIAEVKNTQVRLSIEGAQIIGPVATRNVHEISEDQLKEWLKGNDVEVDGDYDGFVILRCGDDFVGSGKFKEGTIFNYVPKARRLIEVH